MYKSLVLALVTGAAVLGSSTAHAGGNVSWSIGINTPVVGTVISNAPAYYAPVPVYAPAPVYVEAPPVYAPVPVAAYRPAPAPVYYPRQRVYYEPVPVVYERHYPGWRHGHHMDHRRDGRGWHHD